MSKLKSLGSHHAIIKIFFRSYYTKEIYDSLEGRTEGNILDKQLLSPDVQHALVELYKAAGWIGVSFGNDFREYTPFIILANYDQNFQATLQKDIFLE